MSLNNQNIWPCYAKVYNALNLVGPYKSMYTDDITESVNDLCNFSLLDIGCGPGSTVSYLQNSSLASYVGIDATPEMLDIAHKSHGKNAHCSFVHGSIDTKLPFKEGFFDVILSVNSLYTAQNPRFLLREIFRVLKTGGRLIIANPLPTFDPGKILQLHAHSVDDEKFDLKQYTEETLKDLLLDVFGKQQTAEEIYHIMQCDALLRKNNKFHFLTLEQLSALVRLCNFSKIDARLTYAHQSVFLTCLK